MHAVVVDARQHHVAQAELELRRREVRIPRPDGAVIVAEHADQPFREIFGLRERRVRVRALHGTRGRQLQIAEVRLLAGAGRDLRDVQSGSNRTHLSVTYACVISRFAISSAMSLVGRFSARERAKMSVRRSGIFLISASMEAALAPPRYSRPTLMIPPALIT